MKKLKKYLLEIVTTSDILKKNISNTEICLFNPNLKAEVTRAWSRSDFGESVRHFRETLDSSAECLVAIQHGIVSTRALPLGLF